LRMRGPGRQAGLPALLAAIPDADVALKSLQLRSSWTSVLPFPLPSYISKLERLMTQSAPYSTYNAAMQQGMGQPRPAAYLRRPLRRFRRSDQPSAANPSPRSRRVPGSATVIASAATAEASGLRAATTSAEAASTDKTASTANASADSAFWRFIRPFRICSCHAQIVLSYFFYFIFNEIQR